MKELILLSLLLCVASGLPSFSLPSYSSPVLRSKLGRNAYLDGLRKKDVMEDEVTCTTLTCAADGQPCGTTLTGNVEAEIGCNEMDSFCNVTTTTDTTTSGVCLKLSQLGQSCANTGGMCVAGALCSSSNICIVNPYVKQYRPGYPCNTDDMCYWNTTTSGVHRCVSGKCHATPNGSPCSGDDECDSILSFCNGDNVCQAFLQEGAACTADNDICNFPELTCIPSSATSLTGTCQPLYSHGHGATCVGPHQCSFGTCTFESAGPVGVCAAFPDTTTRNKPCSSNADCADFESCECDGTTPKCILQSMGEQQFKDFNGMAECVDHAGYTVSLPDGSLDPTKLASVCKDEMCALYDVTADSEVECDFREFLQQQCDGSSLSLSVGFLAFIVLSVYLMV